MDLIIDVDSSEYKSVIHLTGEIDVYTAPKLNDILLPLTKREKHLVEVNFKNVDYMDSTGLGIFISALKATKQYQSHLKIINLNERENRLFNITGLNTIIDIASKTEVNKNDGTI